MADRWSSGLREGSTGSSPPGETRARPVPEAERAAAESSLAVLLGDPVFARVVPCQLRVSCASRATAVHPGSLPGARNRRCGGDLIRWLF